jgi:hypothetical protein
MAIKIRLWFVLLLATATAAHADVAKCRQPNGSLYVGLAPPERCVPVGSLRSGGSSRQSPPANSDSSGKAGEVRATPPPNPGAAEASGAAKKLETEEKQGVSAIAVRNIVNKIYRDGYLVEGTLGNDGPFPVYDVRICIDHGRACQETAPSTLKPGATGTFSFEVSNRNIPDCTITWTVVPETGR